WSKDQFSLFKNKNREKKRPIKLKLRVELIVFQYLRVGYFPDTFYTFKFLPISKCHKRHLAQPFHPRSAHHTLRYYNSRLSEKY
ncbi:hypothetical protein, partial [Lactobacillus helveticus]|uniref:hypothetical protein n=1 Tax=Lactobacillus helveticus TaxID=1587 RepID=UPI0021AD4261